MTQAPQTRRMAPTDFERSSAARGRSTDDRAQDERPSMEQWSPAATLEVPPSDGVYAYRWVAEFVNGVAIPNNVQRSLREGYQRVRVDELPETFVVDEDKGDGAARSGGLILMKLPLKFAEQRRKFYRDRSRSALAAANTLQGIAGKDAVSEDRGSRTLSGADAAEAIQRMSSGG